jgi:hypothetical protein
MYTGLERPYNIGLPDDKNSKINWLKNAIVVRHLNSKKPG